MVVLNMVKKKNKTYSHHRVSGRSINHTSCGGALIGRSWARTGKVGVGSDIRKTGQRFEVRGQRSKHKGFNFCNLTSAICNSRGTGARRRTNSQSIDCSSLPGLKRTALPGGMETSAPVRGLRPMPVLRGRTLNTPKPRSSMRSPTVSAFFMLSKTVSTARSSFVLVIPVRLTTSLMMSSLITAAPVSRGYQLLKLLMLWDIRRIVNGGTILVIWQHQPKEIS